LLAGLPRDFSATTLIVQHLDPGHRSYLPEILERRSGRRVREAHDGDPVADGLTYVAPPNRHLQVAAHGRVLVLSDSPAVHYVRPSADLLFQSVAAVFGERVTAVVLTGSGSDGATGACHVKRAGGVVIVQDVATAEFASMPRAAVETGCVDQMLPLSEIGDALARRVIGLSSD
jgi:two-component system chemotaxis response regulator CheB